MVSAKRCFTVLSLIFPFLLSINALGYVVDDEVPDVTGRVARISFLSGDAQVRRNGAADWEVAAQNLPRHLIELFQQLQDGLVLLRVGLNQQRIVQGIRHDAGWIRIVAGRSCRSGGTAWSSSTCGRRRQSERSSILRNSGLR